MVFAYGADMASVHVLGNPASREHVQRVATLLSDRGIEPVVLGASSRDDALAVARDAVDAGADRLVAVGGDGVVNIAVNTVAESGTVLGIVPFGTGNDFARAVGLLEGKVERHVERALADPVPVDAIRTDHGWAASVATLGFSGDVTARANALRWPKGQQRYTVATLLQLPRLRILPVSCLVDGAPFVTETTLLAIGNTTHFGGGMRICPGARADDGQLQVVSIGAVPRLRFLRVFPTVFSGAHVDREEVSVTSGTVVELSGADVDLWADGELLGPLPVTLRVVPGALRLAGALN